MRSLAQRVEWRAFTGGGRDDETSQATEAAELTTRGEEGKIGRKKLERDGSVEVRTRR